MNNKRKRSLIYCYLERERAREIDDMEQKYHKQLNTPANELKYTSTATITDTILGKEIDPVLHDILHDGLGNTSADTNKRHTKCLDTLIHIGSYKRIS